MQPLTTGTIAGRVADSSDKPLAGAQVTAKGNAFPYECTATTGSEGTFLFKLLWAGDWEVTVTCSGFQPWVHSFELRAYAVADLDVQLDEA